MSTGIALSGFSNDELLGLMAEDVYDGYTTEVMAEVKEALARGLSPDLILDQGLGLGMARVSTGFRNNQIFVPEVAIAARAMKAGLECLRAGAAPAQVPLLGKAVMGTVRGDLHDLGKTLVSMALAQAGFEVTDLGVNVKTEVFVTTVAAQRPQVLCLSALLSTSMPFVQEVIAALTTAGLRDNVLVIVGGAPLNDGFARQYGADAYCADAASAAAASRAWVQQRAGS
jgi:methylmalonyl-CoA mutase cobalamin-binding domain/chain